MRILQVSLAYAPAWHFGGPPRIMYDYAKALIATGHTVDVLTVEASRPADGVAWDFLGMEVTYLRQTGIGARHYFDNDPREILRWCRANLARYDVVHFSQSRCLLNALVYREALKLGTPYAISSFGSLPCRSEGLKRLYDAVAVRPMIEGAGVCLAQTDHEVQVYREFGATAQSAQILPLAVDLASVPADAQDRGRAFRIRFGIPPACPLMLFLGRLNPTKIGVDLIESFRRARALHPDLHLALVGSDEGMEAALRAAVSIGGCAGAVRFCGPLYGSDRWAAYAAADLFVILPRIYEETSLASLEALAVGTPVLVNACADVPGLDGSGAGERVAPGDVGAAAAVMARFAVMSAPEREEVRRGAAALAVSTFSTAAVGAQLVELLGAVVRRARSRGERV